MAKATNIYLYGKFEYCKLVNPDEYLGVKKWKMNFYPDDTSWKAIKAAKLQKKIKEGQYGKYLSLDRPVLKKWELKNGENPENDPPRLLDKDDNDWDASKLIGNGSSGTIKLQVYDTRMGPGSRIEVVRIEDWVEYDPDSAMPPATNRTAEVPAATTSEIPF